MTADTPRPIEYLIEDEDGAPFPDEFQRVAWDLIHRREAEARDATGLQRAARDLLAAWPNIVNHPRLDNVEIAALRAALAAAPPEPRWPSRDELAKAIHVANGWSPGEWNDGAELDQCYEYADAILAALREGAERP